MVEKRNFCGRILVIFLIVFFTQNAKSQDLYTTHAEGYIPPDKSISGNEGHRKTIIDSAEKKHLISEFTEFNKKAEKLFKIIPIPLYTYSSEAGNVFGLAKYNVVKLYKNDSITHPSKLTEVFTMSSKGRINASVTSELVFKNNKFVLLSFVNFKKNPEYIYGIGNSVDFDSKESITTDRFKFNAVGLYKVYKDFYLGGAIDYANYFKIETDTSSFLAKEQVLGIDGGTHMGVGLSGGWDNRDNRYNSTKGAYLFATAYWYTKALGSTYNYTTLEVDARKFFNPWYKHIIAIQATTSFHNHDVPFYEMAMLGGENKMRGYYKGSLRDNVLVDAQLEYRMPIWNIFGITAWVGTGRVAPSYKQMTIDNFWFSYGGGVRIMVDTQHQTNVRVDFGFGPKGVHGFYINFAEAF